MLNKETLLSLTPSLTGFKDEDHDRSHEWHDEWNFRVENPDRYHIVYGWYEYEDYSGHSYVFGYDKEEEKFFEVVAYHCSCYGLEEGWDPEYFDSTALLAEYLKKFEGKTWSQGQLTLVEFLKENGIEV